MELVMDLALAPALEKACRLDMLYKKISDVVGADLASTPVWNIMIHLYCGAGQRATVPHLVEYLHLPEATALRWVKISIQRQLLVATDEKGAVALSENAERSITKLLMEF
jgi:hypothetical protein